MLADAVIAASPQIQMQACTITQSQTNTPFFNFLRSNINILITSSLNPSLKIPLKMSVAHPLLPPSVSPPALPSYLQLDDSQAEHDDAKDSVRNIKHDMLYRSHCQTLVEIVIECFLLHSSSVNLQKTVVLELNVKECSHSYLPVFKPLITFQNLWTFSLSRNAAVRTSDSQVSQNAFHAKKACSCS